MGSDLSLNQLRMFFLAASCGSVSVAAKKLCVSQPAVSMQIRALEKHYGVRLFDRRGKELGLTEQGKRLFQVSQRIFALVGEAETILLQSSGFSPDFLRIGSTKTCVRHLLAGNISKFQELFPGIQILINEGSSEEMIRSVAENRSDLAIVGRMQYPDKIRAIPFIRDEIFLLVSPRHRLARETVIKIEDLKDENLILREKGSGTRKVIEAQFESRGVALTGFIETGNVDLIKEMVSMGKGVAFLASMGVNQDIIRNGRLKVVEVEGGPFLLDIDIVVNIDRKLSREDEAFIRVLSPDWKRIGFI